MLMTMLMTTLVTVSSLSSMAARAATGLLPVDASAMGQDQARVRRGIVEGARDVLKADVVVIDAVAVPGGMTRCLADQACLRGLIDSRGVDALAAFVVTPMTKSPAWADVHVVVYDLELLTLLLSETGFDQIERLAFGESTHPPLQGIDGHSLGELQGLAMAVEARKPILDWRSVADRAAGSVFGSSNCVARPLA